MSKPIKDKTFNILNKIHFNVEKGQKEGYIKCPYCDGNIHYIYINTMAMRAKCDSCDFKMFS